MQNWLNKKTIDIAGALIDQNRMDGANNISGYGTRQRVLDLLDQLKCALFPSVYESDDTYEKYLARTVHKRVTGAAVLLNILLHQVLHRLCCSENKDSADCNQCENKADDITMKFINTLPEVRRMLTMDVQAAFDGDPAAKSLEEVIIAYPCIQAITTYRLAHELWIHSVPLIPRLMTEIAHEATGIDIHPGAAIGKSFFIDHGTGVVIGETATIGDNVKLYQGVTLGAKSFETDEKGTILAVKRHPNIENNVIIYSGASILGGDVTVGHDSVIGGNVWLTRSVKPYTMVYNSTPAPVIREKDFKRDDDYQI